MTSTLKISLLIFIVLSLATTLFPPVNLYVDKRNYTEGYRGKEYFSQPYFTQNLKKEFIENFSPKSTYDFLFLSQSRKIFVGWGWDNKTAVSAKAYAYVYRTIIVTDLVLHYLLVLLFSSAIYFFLSLKK